MTISEETRARIRRLFYAEHWTVGTIAAQLDVHHETVRRAIGSDTFVNKGKVRLSALDPFVGLAAATLLQYPRLTASRLHEMLRVRGYPGSVVQLRRRIRQLGLRPTPRREAFFRLETRPGEQAQVDWGYYGTLRVGSIRRKVWFLAVVLSYSRAIHLHFSFDQSVASVLRGHLAAFDAFGGVARNHLYDNMKTVVLERVGDAIRFHPRFMELCAHYLFSALPCAPGRGNEKGRVERQIRYLRSSFFPARHFSDLDDMARQFEQWRDEVAYLRPCPQDPDITVAQAFERERDQLLPLPDYPLDTDEVRAVIARKQPYVLLDTNRYSIPHHLVGHTLTIVFNDRRVRVLLHDEIIAEHRRCWLRGACIEERAHLEGLARAKQKARAQRGRHLVIEQVPASAALFDELARRGEPLAPQTVALMQLLDLYGPVALGKAVEQALQRATPYAPSVQHILEAARRDSPPPLPSALRLDVRPEVRELRVFDHPLEDYDAIGEKDPDDSAR